MRPYTLQRTHTTNSICLLRYHSFHCKFWISDVKVCSLANQNIDNKSLVAKYAIHCTLLVSIFGACSLMSRSAASMLGFGTMPWLADRPSVEEEGGSRYILSRKKYTWNVQIKIYTWNILIKIYTCNIHIKIYTWNILIKIYTWNIMMKIYTWYVHYYNKHNKKCTN
jgi:hypothetical protein